MTHSVPSPQRVAGDVSSSNAGTLYSHRNPKLTMVDRRTAQLVAEAARLVESSSSNPVQDAANERARATFDASELAAFMNGGTERIQRRWVPCDIIIYVTLSLHLLSITCDSCRCAGLSWPRS